jgi:2-oxoisovalerate dehydrogenase E1 component
LLEPIALYHQRDLYADGDGGWLAGYAPPTAWAEQHVPIGRARRWVLEGAGSDLTLLTFGNGVPMSLRAANKLAGKGISARVIDLRWLSPLPTADILREAVATGRVLIADETRKSGGVSEAVIAALVDGGFRGSIARVSSADSFIPLGDAARLVLLDEQRILQAALAMMGER